MIDIGPWSFTLQDARRTLEVLHEVVGHAAWQRPEGMFDALGERARQVQLAEHLPLEQRLQMAWHVLTGLRSTLHDHGLVPRRADGAITGMFTSNGGVPKVATAQANVTHRGLEGDRQATRRHHGRPWQALCLWSAEVVTALARQGHPIVPGAAGENVSVTGIAWADVRPGVRLQMGEVLCEVSTYAIPCRKNAQWFQDGRFNTMHHSNGPVSRVYATVLEPGSIAVGDVAILEP